jgi:hypothetical protein
MCRAVLKTTMEKRAAAICCLLISILLFCAIQGETKSVFCKCYEDCYNDCRHQGNNTSACGFFCFAKCPLTRPPRSAADCAGICQQLSLCGVAATTGE